MWLITIIIFTICEKNGDDYIDLGNSIKNELIDNNEKNKYYINDYKIDPNCKNDSHTFIATQIKTNTTVLDVGCAQGIIGKYLNDELHCKVYGIEIDEIARKLAIEKHCYKEVYSFSVTDKKSSEYKNFFKSNIKFDYIIFADLLEHLIDPANVIYEYQKLLKPTGKILISMPNIAHFDIIYGLLNDRFNYSKTGLLDNTHLRFFTRNSFIDMINQMNEHYNLKFKIKLIATTVIVPDYCNEEEKIYSILMKYKNVNVLQNIFELSYDKNPKNTKEKINLYKILENEYQKLIHGNDELNEKINNINKMYKDLELEKNRILESKIILDSEKSDILKKYAELEAYNEKLQKEKENTITELKNSNQKLQKEKENAITELKNSNQKLQKEKENIITEFNTTNETLQGIYDSKTWKFLGKTKKILRLLGIRRN